MIKKTLIASLLISILGIAYSIEVSNTHVSSYLEEPLRLEADLKGVGEIKLAAPTEYLKFNHPVLNYDVSLQVVGEGENRRLVLSSTESIDDPSVVILLEAKDANNNVQVFELPVLLDFKATPPSVIEIDGDAPKTEAPKADTKVADAKPKKADEKKPVDNKTKINEPTKVEMPPKVDAKAVAAAKAKADELAKDKAAAQARLDAKTKVETDAKLEAKTQTEEKAKVAAQAKLDAKAQAEEKAKAAAQAKLEAKTQAEEKAKVAAQAKLDAKAQAEEKAKVAAQAKLDAKAQAEEKAKAAAQAKLEAKTQAEEKAKVAAQAKLDAKAQAEEKAKVAAQAKLDAKAQAEEKAKVAAQVKLDAKAQAEEKAKATAQAKLEAKAQAEEKAKVAAQAKLDAKAQAEEKAKVAAQVKLDERAALDARVQAEAQARFEANTKTQTLQTEADSAPIASPSASHYGPVKDGETLWSIANKVKPSSVSTQNMLEALRKQNPRAFSRGVLLKGATLVVPDLLNSNATPAQNESSIIKTERIESPEMVNNKIEEIVIGIIYELPPIPEKEAPPAIIEEPPVVIEEPPVAIEPPSAVIEEPPVVIEEPPVAIEPPPAIIEEPPVVIEEPPVAIEPPPAIIEEPPVVIEPPVVKMPPVTPTPQIEDRGIIGLLIDNIVYIGIAFFAVIMGLLGLVFIRHNREEKRIDDELNQLNREFSTEEELFIGELSSDDISSIIDEPIEEFDFDALDEIIAEDEPSTLDDLSEEAHEISEQDIFLSENLEALKTAPKKDYTEDAGENLAFDLETLTTDLTPSGAKIEKITPQDEDVSGFVESMTDLEGALTDDRQEFAFDSIEKISEMEPSEVTAPFSEEIADKSEDYESVQVKLDLAEAYIKIDKSLASPLLEEVIRDGNPEQIKQAERLKAEELSADIYEAMDSQEAFETPDEEIDQSESIDLPEEVDFPDPDELFEETDLIEEVIDTPEEIVTSDDLPEIMEVTEEQEQEIEPVSEEEVHDDYESERIKLELAEAYLNFDVTLAIPLLAEVLRNGNPEQIAKAQAILDKL